MITVQESAIIDRLINDPRFNRSAIHLLHSGCSFQDVVRSLAACAGISYDAAYVAVDIAETQEEERRSLELQTAELS